MEPYPLHRKHRVPTTGPPGKSPDISFISCPSWAFLDIQDLIRSDFTQLKKKKKILQDLQVGEQSLKESGPYKELVLLSHWDQIYTWPNSFYLIFTYFLEGAYVVKLEDLI